MTRSFATRCFATLSAGVALALGLALIHSGQTTVRARNAVTFNEHIGPLLFNNCTVCHRPGEAAPFSLLSYSDARKRGPTIAAVTHSRYMPPWHAAPGFGEFQDERRLTDEQIALIGQWVKEGMPEGDSRKQPSPPQYTQGWQLGKPDLIVAMPKGYEVPATGPDVYRNFVVPLNLMEDKWVRAIEFRPGTRSVVHHCLFSYDTTGALLKKDGADGKPGFSGMGAGFGGFSLSRRNSEDGMPRSGSLGGWAVGAMPVPLQDGLAMPLPKGADLVLQAHFHPTGKAETEISTVGIYFADKAPERTLMGLQVPAMFGIGSGMKIAPGKKDYVIRDSFELPVDMRIYSAGAHAHYLAKNMKMVATLPDGTSKPLLWIPDWDFAWQDRYRFKDPIVLPKGTRIEAEISYDNTSENPHQPSNPPKQVWWGEGSFDEMGSMSVQGVCIRKEDERIFAAAVRAATMKALRAAWTDGTLMRVGQSMMGSR